MIEPSEINSAIRSIESPVPHIPSVLLAVLVATIGFKFINKFLLAGLTPLQRRRRIRRALISRKTHPSRSKFTGAQFCRRQGLGK